LIVADSNQKDTIQLQVVSPERQLVDEQVTEAQVPALEGYIGVLPGHARLLSALKPGGVLTYQAGGQEKALAVYGGFVEVLPDRVRVLADAAEFREEINAADAQKKLEEAMKAMEATPAPDADPAAAVDLVMQAQARVDAAGRK
jgi:F-type H+-transporting ATPase subunit epsilon